ncbi:MAG: hypothetical protein AABX03_02795 [Nanoarchaeota archaeon]
MGWKSWSYWLKGGIIGLLLPIFFSICMIFLFLIGGANKREFLSADGSGAMMTVFALFFGIIFMIIGIIIGFIIGKVKSKNNQL